MSGRRLRGPLLIFLLVVAGTGLGIGLGLRGSGGPPRVSEVPATLPAGGVDVGGQVVLKPLAHPPVHALSKGAAIAKARRYAVRRPSGSTALEASVTFRGSKISNRAAWVVTFTSRKPVKVAKARNVQVSHFSIVLDAITGKLLVGFATK